MIRFHQGKVFTRIKALYIIQKSEIGNFPDDSSLSVNESFTETFEEIKFLPNTGSIAITPQQTNHGTYYNIVANCQLNKNSLTTTTELDKYKFKELIAIVVDPDDQKILIGGSSIEQFCKLTFGLSIGTTNIYSVGISANSADYPPFYTGSITSN